jgi:hypothetical protein
MTAKQLLNSLQTPDGGYYVTLTDGNGNLVSAGGSSGITIGTTAITGGATTQVLFNLAGKVSSDTGFTYAGSGGGTTLSGNLTASSVSAGGFNNGPGSAMFLGNDTTPLIYLIPTTATQFGGMDSAAPVAQVLKIQSGATLNTAGVSGTIIGSLSSGSGTSGDLIFQTGTKSGVSGTQATATTALTIKGETQACIFAGIITVLGATSPILTTTTTVTTGAGSSAGTLTNAPSVGNPTKWIPFNDAGTTRYIPAW